MPDPHPPAADGERDLPEEIVKAITRFECEVRGFYMAPYAQGIVQARSALTTSILSRLTAAEADAEDAARFRALMRCGRIEPQDSAGVDCFTGGRTYPDHPGMVHFGAEFWVQPEAALSPFTVWGRHCLRALADDILAYEAAALTEAQPKGDQ